MIPKTHEASGDLGENARQSIARLGALQRHATESKHRRFTENSKDLLDRVAQVCQRDGQLLTAWKDSVITAGQTSDETRIKTVRDTFVELESHLQKVEDDLDARLRLRYRTLTAWSPSSK